MANAPSHQPARAGRAVASTCNWRDRLRASVRACCGAISTTTIADRALPGSERASSPRRLLGRRCLRRDDPCGQREAQRFVTYQPRARGNACGFGAVRAARRRNSPASRRDHRALRDDRDRAGARQPRRHPQRRRPGRDLHRPLGPVAGAGLQAASSTTSSPRWRRPSTTSSRAPRRMAWWPASTTAAATSLGAHRPVASRFVTVSSDARLIAAGSQQVLSRNAPALNEEGTSP